jgi:5'-nucleotidase
MRLLLTNDDGITAPGLRALLGVARQLGQVRVVAPTKCCSSCGHQVTTTQPVQVHEHAADELAVEGWPADCVRVALRGLEIPTDWVLSGINAGGNLGADVYLSGTVAAAREAVLLGRPAIALSQYKRREMDFDWEQSARWVLPILRELTSRAWQPGTLWNVNLPHLPSGSPMPAVVYCELDPHPLPVRYTREGNSFRYNGDYHGRPRHADSDVAVCMGGQIAVTLLRLR